MTRTQRYTTHVLIALSVLLLAGTASAEGFLGSWDVSGTSAGSGTYSGSVSVSQSSSGEIKANYDIAYADGRDQRFTARGRLDESGRVLTLRTTIRNQTLLNVLGDLFRSSRSRRSKIDMSWTIELADDGTAHGTVTSNRNRPGNGEETWSKGQPQRFREFVEANFHRIHYPSWGYEDENGQVQVDCADTYLILIALYAFETDQDLLLESQGAAFRLSTYIRKYGPERGLRRFTGHICGRFGTWHLPDFSSLVSKDFAKAESGDILFKPGTYGENGEPHMGHTTMLVGFQTREQVAAEVAESHDSEVREEFGDLRGDDALLPYMSYRIFASTVGVDGPWLRDIATRRRYIGSGSGNYLSEVRRIDPAILSGDLPGVEPGMGLAFRQPEPPAPAGEEDGGEGLTLPTLNSPGH